MNRIATTALALLYIVSLALGIYEMTAKSPSLLGTRLPGWGATRRAEKMTKWNPTTGIFPLDKLLHEGQETVKFYGFLYNMRS